MSDRIRFGLFLDLFLLPLKFIEFEALALEGEGLGYDSVWICDHLMKREAPILECWTTLSALCSKTDKVRLGTLVACNSFRNPALLAKMAATLDVISKGRLELGIGAGWNQDEHQAYGVPFPKISVRVEQMREGIEIIKRMWTEEKVNYRGRYFRVKDASCEPKPLQEPHPPITVGGGGEKLTLKVTAEHANRSNWFGTPEQCKHKLNVLEKYCSQIGRDHEEIEKSVSLGVNISYDEQELTKNLKKCYASGEPHLSFHDWLKEFRTKMIGGPPSKCLEKMREYVDLGITYFMLRFLDLPSEKGMKLFNEEVIQKI